MFLPSMIEVVVCDERATWDGFDSCREPMRDVSDCCHASTPCLDDEARDTTHGNDWSRRDHLKTQRRHQSSMLRNPSPTTRKNIIIKLCRIQFDSG